MASAASTDFEDWVRCGLGRAVLWLEAHDDAPHRDLLLSLCLAESAYDAQCEGSRAGYLYDLIRRTRAPELYRRCALDALRSAAGDGRDDEFRIRLGAWFAEEGDEEFRVVLYAKAREDHPAFDRLILEIAAIDGVEGLLRVAASRPAGRPHGDPGWIEHVLESRDGEGPARDALAAARSGSAAFAAMLPVAEKDGGTDRERLVREDAPYEEVRPFLGKGPVSFSEGLDLRVWGRAAPDAEIERAARDLLAQDDSDADRIENGLKIFLWRPFPLGVSRLIEWSSRPEPLGRIASHALEKVVHPDARAHALRLIGADRALGHAAGCLVRNLEPGDWELLRDLSERELDPVEYHGIGLAIVEVAEDAGRDALAALLAQYERNRCSLCRESVVRRLDSLGAVPDWMRDECRFDSNDEIRAWAGGAP